MAVTTETKPGTMTDEEGRSKVSPETEVKTPAGEEVSPEEEPKFTQKQLDALLKHGIDSEVGRKIKPLEDERNTLKGEVKKLTERIDDIQAERDSLREDIEGLTQDDPKKFDLIKRDKELRDKERKYKDDLNALEQDKQTHAENIKLANDTLLEIRVWDIANEYDGGDAVRLKALCETFSATSEDQIRKIAETLWNKQVEQVEKKPKAPKAYSGKNDGGSSYFTREQISDRTFYESHRDEILKAAKEGRIRD